MLSCGSKHGDAGEVEIMVALRGEDFGEPRGRVRLEARGSEVAQHRIIAGFVGLIERKQSRADQNQNPVLVDIGGPWRLLQA